jgi:outer membrane protein W
MAEGLKQGCEEFVKAPRQDNISLKQAAPIVTEAPLKAASSDEKFGSIIKVIPYSGLTTLMSEGESLEAGLVGGIKVETNVNKRFSVGMGFNYTSLTTEDFGSNSNYLGNFNNQYNSFYGGMEIDYKNMNFGIHSKFFIIKNDRFRPYVGAGFGYNRTSLEYSNNTNANAGYTAGAFNNFSFGNEEVTTSSVNLELMIGSEIKFTESIGANLELNYVRVLGGNISTENGLNTAFNPDQQRLEDLSSELSEANIVSLFAGLLVEF